jgi:hypothetical protein
MTDYEPWAGTNFNDALRAEPLEKQRKRLSFLVFKNDDCIAAFKKEEDAKLFKGRKRLIIKKIPFYTPIPS